MKKKDGKLRDFWETALLLVLIQSLMVPWAPIYERSLIRHATTDGFLEQSEASLGNWRKTGYDPLSPIWRERTLRNMVRILYPEDGLLVRVLTDVLPAPSQGSMSPSRGVPPSHPEGASFLEDPQGSAMEESLSLEDSDLIDVLWRHDIEQEKGVASFSFFPSPDLQHDEDVHLLSEKHMSQALGWNEGQQHNLYNRLSKAYEELKCAQKDFHSGDPFNYQDRLFWEEKSDATSSENKGTSSLLEAKEVPKELFGLEQSVEEAMCNKDEDWDFLFDGESTAPANDVCLASAIDEDLLSPVMERRNQSWDTGASRPMDLSFGGEIDDIPTPDLELSPSDLSRIFSDSQVTADVAASTSMLLDQASGSMEVRPVGRSMRAREQSVPTSSMEDSDVLLEFFPELDHSELVPGKDLPMMEPHSPRLLSPTCASGPSPSHVDHDHMYWSASPEEARTSMSGSGGEEEEERGRSVGKLVPAQVPDIKEELLEEEESEEEEEFQEGSSGSRERRTGRRSQDEDLARRYNLPFTAAEISAMPLQEFQRVTKADYLTSEQLEVVKKIRRRGKNKLAARNCRKRKVSSLDHLGMETSILNQELDVESAANQELLHQISEEQKEIAKLESQLKGQGQR